MEMNLQRDGKRMSREQHQHSDEPRCASVSQMRQSDFPLKHHPNTGRAGTAGSVWGPALSMEQFRAAAFSVEASEGGLKELVRRWFIDTQASHILQDGHFPDWFQGFATRK